MTGIRRRIVGGAALLGVAGAILAFLILRGPTAPASRANLVVILVDTLRPDHLGFMDYARPTSPHLDLLAARSVVFANHYSSASRTGPSVASLFTGLHPPSHGVINPITLVDAKGTLAPDQTTLAEILSEKGYRCAGFTANFNVSERFGFGQGFGVYEWIRSPDTPLGLGGRATEVNAAALTWLIDAEAPFFLYLHYLDPHSPYDAPPPYDRVFTDPAYRGPFTGSHVQLDEVIAGSLAVDPSDLRHLVALYDQEISYVDAMIGDLLDTLEQDGLLENTVVVFLSDHGEEFLEHGSVLHGYTLYEEQLRIPLVICDPQRPGPRRVEPVTRQVDVLPTLLELLDVPYAGWIEGRSVVHLMGEGTVEEAVPPVYAMASLMAMKTVQREALMLDGWKYIRSERPDPAEELYDLAADPGETADLSVARAERTESLRHALDALRGSFRSAVADTVVLTEEERERLRSVGYVQ